MISKILDRIQEDLDFIKKIATEENFKRLEEKCDFVNTRNKELQKRINKAIEYNKKNIHSHTLDNILKGDNK